MIRRAAVAVAALLVGTVMAAILVSAPAGASLQFEDQIGSWVVPILAVQQAADIWGVPVTYGGAPACHQTWVICMDRLPAAWPGLPGQLLGETVGHAIVISPAVLSRSPREQVFVLAHEMGNALGVPEQPCGAHNVMSRCWDGYLKRG